MTKRALVPLSIVVVAAGCSLIIPLDEFGETASSGQGGAGGAGASGAGASGAGGSGAAGGAGPFECLERFATNEDQCGEPDYVCESTCADCLCAWHQVASLEQAGNDAVLYDFDLDGAVGAVSIVGIAPPMLTAIAPFTVSGSGWVVTTDFFTRNTVVERLIVDGPNLFFANALGIRSRTFDDPPVEKVLCAADADDTLDHLALRSGTVFRSRIGMGAGRIERCSAGIPDPAEVFNSAETDAVWEIEATDDTIYWTNRKPGGGVYSKPSAKAGFDSTAPTTIHESAGGVPFALEVVQGKAYFTDCESGEIYEDGSPVASGLVHPIFMTAVDDGGELPTFYVIEANDADFVCFPNLPLTADATLVRYRDGQRRVLAEHIIVPTTVKVFGEHVYFAHHPEDAPPEADRVPR